MSIPLTNSNEYDHASFIADEKKLYTDEKKHNTFSITNCLYFPSSLQSSQQLENGKLSPKFEIYLL